MNHKSPDDERADLLRRRQELWTDIDGNILTLDVDSGAGTNRRARINDIRIMRELVVEISSRLLDIEAADIAQDE